METQRPARKTALVLTGGGAKGAFQFAAERYAREVRGYRWDVIAGVSVGALNASMLAMEKYRELEELWTGDLTGRIYTGDLRWWSILSFGLKHLPGFIGIRSLPFLNFDTRSILGNEPLRRLIDQSFERDKVRHDLRIGVVSLQTGLYHVYRLADRQFYRRGQETPDGGSGDYEPVQLDDRQFKQLILASTAIPVIWPPEELGGPASVRAAVDGGLRNINPIGDVLDSLESHDEVVIISCNPSGIGEVARAPTTGVAIALRALEIALAEIARTDIHEFERINAIVEQAARGGTTLTNKKGEPFRYFNWHLIEPTAPLDDTLDFSPAALKRSIEEGEKRARSVLG